MRYLEINKDWKFKDLLPHLEDLRKQYWDSLAFFSYFDLHEKVVFMRHTRDSFYALKFEEWKKDKVWDYMNGFIFLYELKRLR